jgi:hypothetical protein
MLGAEADEKGGVLEFKRLYHQIWPVKNIFEKIAAGRRKG